MTTSFFQRLTYHARTAFLFTKSDMKSIEIPVTIFAAVVAPLASLDRIPHVAFWIWLNLLQFCLSNQTVRPEEDLVNKADRPIPAGRITVQQAKVLRWLLVPLCFGHALLYGVEVFYASLLLALLTFLYNELNSGSRSWFLKNIINAGGFLSFEIGGTLIAARDPSQLDSNATLAICLSAAVIATTIHAQDFKDIVGDRLVGRKTLPIVFATHGRKTIFVGLLVWSFVLARVWKLDLVASSLFIILATTVGVRFQTRTSVSDDQVSFYLYNVWLSLAHALPAYRRLLL